MFGTNAGKVTAGLVDSIMTARFLTNVTCMRADLLSSLKPEISIICSPSLSIYGTFTNYVSGTDNAIGPQLRACLCFNMMTVKWHGIWPRYLAWWFILTQSESLLKVKVISQSSSLQEDNVAIFHENFGNSKLYMDHMHKSWLSFEMNRNVFRISLLHVEWWNWATSHVCGCTGTTVNITV